MGKNQNYMMTNRGTWGYSHNTAAGTLPLHQSHKKWVLQRKYNFYITSKIFKRNSCCLQVISNQKLECEYWLWSVYDLYLSITVGSDRLTLTRVLTKKGQKAKKKIIMENLTSKNKGMQNSWENEKKYNVENSVQ